MKKINARIIKIMLAAVAPALPAPSLIAADVKTGAASEKEKALQSPYANDLGPETIDISKYPKEHQKTYAGALKKCAKCHSLARPLNSQFLELPAAELDAFKKANPDAAKNPFLVQPEDGIWKRYVKRMMAKPGCDIKPEEGKAIYKFLEYDSKTRKTGDHLKSWIEHRQKLLAGFKAKHAARYEEIYGDYQDPSARP